MPPKKSQKGEPRGERDSQLVEERGKALKMKKSVEEAESSEELRYLNALGKCIDEESSAETVSAKTITPREQFFSANLNEDKLEDDSSIDGVLDC